MLGLWWSSAAPRRGLERRSPICTTASAGPGGTGALLVLCLLRLAVEAARLPIFGTAFAGPGGVGALVVHLLAPAVLVLGLLVVHLLAPAMLGLWWTSPPGGALACRTAPVAAAAAAFACASVWRDVDGE